LYSAWAVERDYDMVKFLLYKSANGNVLGDEGSAGILAVEDMRQFTDEGPSSYLKGNALCILKLLHQKTPDSKMCVCI
jgi:hypothetical protein